MGGRRGGCDCETWAASAFIRGWVRLEVDVVVGNVGDSEG